MKSIRLFSILTLFICFANFSFAQSVKKESFHVSGNCGMCKKTIETAAKKAGASFAEWNEDSKVLTVEYNSTASNPAKIQKSVAASGYDTKEFKANDAAYKKLHACCQYDRAMSASATASCCTDGGCSSKEKCTEMACCKDGKCSMASTDNHQSKTMDCCKDGKCSMEGHNGKDCCKKS